MAKIGRWDSKENVQSFMVDMPGMSPKWAKENWWQDFNKAKDECFKGRKVAAKPDETERDGLASDLMAYVRSSGKWYGGEWVGHPGLADWHVNAWLRTPKRKKATSKVSGSHQPEEDQAEMNQTEKNPPPARSGEASASGTFYDTAYDV